MLIPRFVIGCFSLAMMFFWSGVASGQSYPNRPVRILTSQPGGAGDVASRLIAPSLSLSLGQPVVIDNRTSTVISAQVVAQATPDGHTLTVYGGTLWINPLMQPSGYDPIRDLAAICMLTQAPSVIVVNPQLAVSSIRELITLAKAKPGMLNYGSGTSGSVSHLGMELFKSMAAVDILRIPYKGAGPAITAVAAGETQVMIANIGALPYIKTGRMKALAVTTAKPSILLPNLPTVSASGLPGYEMVGTLGMLTTAKTSKAIINRLNQEVVRILNEKDTKQRLLTDGVEVVGSTPAEFAAAIKSESARMGKLIKHAGIRLE